MPRHVLGDTVLHIKYTHVPTYSTPLGVHNLGSSRSQPRQCMCPPYHHFGTCVSLHARVTHTR